MALVRSRNGLSSTQHCTALTAMTVWVHPAHYQSPLAALPACCFTVCCSTARSASRCAGTTPAAAGICISASCRSTIWPLQAAHPALPYKLMPALPGHHVLAWPKPPLSPSLLLTWTCHCVPEGPGQPALHNGCPCYWEFFIAPAGGGYHVFAGKECSRALAKMKISAEDCNDLLSDCTVREMETLKDWETRFAEKYGVVGQVGGWSEGLYLSLEGGTAIQGDVQCSAVRGGGQEARRGCFLLVGGMLCASNHDPEEMHGVALQARWMST